MFNVTNIKDSDVILRFLWLKTTEPLIFWAQRMVAFPEEPNRKIFLKIVIKGKSLHFNIMCSEELMARLQEEGSQIKVLWYKDSRQVSLLSEKKKVVPE